MTTPNQPQEALCTNCHKPLGSLVVACPSTDETLRGMCEACADKRLQPQEAKACSDHDPRSTYDYRLGRKEMAEEIEKMVLEPDIPQGAGPNEPLWDQGWNTGYNSTLTWMRRNLGQIITRLKNEEKT